MGSPSFEAFLKKYLPLFHDNVGSLAQISQFVFLASFLSLDFVVCLNSDHEKTFEKVNAVRGILLKSKELLMCTTTHTKKVIAKLGC